MSPPRIALLAAALFVLSGALIVAGARYPDEEFDLTVEQAQAAFDVFQRDGSQRPECFEDRPDPERPCGAAYLHNFPARARVVTGAIAVALVLTGAAFRRQYDATGP